MITLADIKESVEQFRSQYESSLSHRDTLGLNKVIYELDLLAPHEEKPKKKKKEDATAE